MSNYKEALFHHPIGIYRIESIMPTNNEELSIEAKARIGKYIVFPFPIQWNTPLQAFYVNFLNMDDWGGKMLQTSRVGECGLEVSSDGNEFRVKTRNTIYEFWRVM